jgi:hypothetical protein
MLILSFYINIISCEYLFIGETGCGKSWIVDGLTDHKYNVKSELQPSSVTRENTFYDEYIDTIGLDDTNLGKYRNMPEWLQSLVPKNTDINGLSVGLLAIYNSLDKIKQNGKKLNKILFVIDNIRVSDSLRSILPILKTMIKANLLLIINKVDDLEKTKYAYEKHRKEFEDIFGSHDVVYFKRAEKETLQYKTNITELKHTLKKYDKDDLNYELNKNHIDIILKGDPDFILNYYKNLNCEGYGNSLKTINDQILNTVNPKCDNGVAQCYGCHRQVVDEKCNFFRCKDIWGDVCSYNQRCVKDVHANHAKCLEVVKTLSHQKDKWNEERNNIEKYLLDNCDISKRTPEKVNEEL